MNKINVDKSIDYINTLKQNEEQAKEIKRLNKDIDDLQNRFNSLMEAHKISDEENERLNNIINNPEDLTLCKMWADTKLKEEIERLNKIIQELEDEIMIIFKNRLESHELNVEHYKEKIKDYERWFKELKEKINNE